MSAADDDARNREFIAHLGTMLNDVFVGVAEAALASITDGSARTGAPGQPVGQYGPGYHQGMVGGNLKSSWQLTFPTPDSASIGTKVIYAEGIEDLVGPHGPITIRSTVGGGHSVKQTHANLDRLVEDVTRRVMGT